MVIDWVVNESNGISLANGDDYYIIGMRDKDILEKVVFWGNV